MRSEPGVAETEPKADHIPGVEVANGEDAAAETPLEWDREANIHIRLFRAAHSIGMLEKDGTVKMSGGGYGYITHDQTTMQAKRAFRANGILPRPTVAEHSKDGNRTELTVECFFVNVDKPDDYISVRGVGYGVDSSDKGPGKAFSYAMKYIYMKALMLNSADDIEASDTTHQPEVSQAHMAREAANVKSTKEAWASTFKAAIESSRSFAELKELEKTNRKQLMSDDLPEVTRDYFDELIEARKMELSA